MSMSESRIKMSLHRFYVLLLPFVVSVPILNPYRKTFILILLKQSDVLFTRLCLCILHQL